MLILVAVTVNLTNEKGGLFVTTRKAASETKAAAEKETLSAELVGAIKAGGEFDISAVNLPDNMKWCDEGDNDFNSVSKGQPSKGEASWVITKNNNKFYVNENGNLSDTAPMIYEDALAKGWVYLEAEGVKGVIYGGAESVTVTQIINNVPVFKGEGENDKDLVFKGYQNVDVTQSGIVVSFCQNEKVESVDFNGVNVSLLDDGFADCTNLKSVTGMEGITEILSNTFDSCTSLTNITIPSSITSIDSTAFINCTNLTQITINKAQDSISGAPWGAPNATVTWQE